MKLLVKADMGLHVELDPNEAKMFVDNFLKLCEIGQGQEEINQVIELYKDDPLQVNYAIMIQ